LSPPGDRPRTEALVEAQPFRVLATNLGVATQGRLVRQALEKEAGRVQRKGLLTNTLVERPADPASFQPGTGRNEVQKAEVDLRLVHEKRETVNPPLPVVRNQEHRSEPVLQRVAKLLRELLDLVRRDERKLRLEDRLHLPDGVLIDGDRIVVDAPDPKHP
jgi:hypothetical protein